MSTDTLTLTQYAMPTAQAARYLGRSPATLTKWRLNGEGPRYSQHGNSGAKNAGGRIFYRTADLKEWADTGRNVPLTEAPEPEYDPVAPCVLTEAQAAALIGRSAATLRGWRSGRAGGGPRYIKHEGKAAAYYRPADLREWIDQGLIEIYPRATRSTRQPPTAPVRITVSAPAPAHGGDDK